MIQRNNDSKRSTGAAHIGFSMFGARGPLLNEVDAGGGSASGGSSGGTTNEGANNGSNGQATGNASGQQSKTVTMTQADFDRHIQERIDRDRKARGASNGTNGQQSTQRQETRQSEGTGQTQQQANGATSVDAVFQLEMNDAIEAIEEKMGVKLPASAKKRIRTVGSVERPGDKEAYVTGWVNDLGLGKKTDNTQNTNQSTGQQTQQQNGQQTNNGFSSDKGGANGGETRDFEQLSLERPLELTQDDIQRMHLKHGEEKANGMIRDRVNAYLRNIKLVADPRRLEMMRRAKQ